MLLKDAHPDAMRDPKISNDFMNGPYGGQWLCGVSAVPLETKIPKMVTNTCYKSCIFLNVCLQLGPWSHGIKVLVFNLTCSSCRRRCLFFGPQEEAFCDTELCISWEMHMVGGSLWAPCDPLYIACNPFNCHSLGRHAHIFGITWSKLVLLLGLVLYWKFLCGQLDAWWLFGGGTPVLFYDHDS